jgi:hypothetical protein
LIGRVSSSSSLVICQESIRTRLNKMELGIVSVKDKRRKSNGCQCSSLPGFSF